MADKAIPDTRIAFEGQTRYRGHTRTERGNFNPGANTFASIPALFYEKPSHHKDLPPVLRKLKAKVVGFLANPFDYLPDLKKLNWHREIKKYQRREAICGVIEYLAHHIDVITLKCRPFTLAELSIATGIGLKRVKRAVADLAKAGYIVTVIKRIKQAFGGYRTVAALREVSTKLFHHLGITSEYLKTQRNRKRVIEEKRINLSTYQHLEQRFKPQGNVMQKAIHILKQLTRGKPPDG